MLLICLEWWSFEILTIITSQISVNATAAQVIIMNIMCVLYAISLGMQVTCYTLIGKSIGAMDIPLARRYRKMLTAVGISLQIF